MTLLLAEQPDVQGHQRPRLWSAPAHDSTSGDDAVDLADRAGLELDPWQQFVLRHALGERDDGRWSASTVGLVCPRQNGKNAILEARELAGLFLFGEQVIIHSAHEQSTASEQFRRILGLIENTPEMRRRMKRSIHGKGSEAIELKSGQRILFKTRTGGGARGFSVDCIVFDESYELSEAAISALVPTMSTSPNPQTWYTSSAIDQEKHRNGVALARLRERGIEGRAELAYFEWSVDSDNPSRVPLAVASDPAVWAQCNPGLGIRISPEWVHHEQQVEMGPREFAVERLGVGDWPDTDASSKTISLATWAALEDPDSRLTGRPCFAFDVAPDRSSAAIAVAGTRSGDLEHVEVIAHGPGTEWVTARLAALVAPQRPLAVICDASGPAGSLLADLAALKVKVTTVNVGEHAQACGMFYDTVHQGGLRHGPQPELVEALDGATKRPLGDGGWAWSRKTSAVDISPLVAVTLAHWGSRRFARKHARVIGPSDIERMRAERDARRAAEEGEGD